MRKRASFRPQLEALESRWLLSTLTVLNTHDSGDGSLRADIAAANSGDVIRFDRSLAGQTIRLTSGQLVVNKSLDIEGLGAAKLSISGNNSSRVFDVSNAATVTIADLTITDGRVVDDGGGAIKNEAGSTLNLVRDAVANNTAYGVGGGLWNQIGATVAIDNSTFAGNKALGSLNFSEPAEGFSAGDGTAEGGAIETDGGAVIRNSTFTGNLAVGATGGAVDGAHGGAIGVNGSVTIADGIFAGNQARGGDGGDGGGAAAAARRRAARSPLTTPRRWLTSITACLRTISPSAVAAVRAERALTAATAA